MFLFHHLFKKEEGDDGSEYKEIEIIVPRAMVSTLIAPGEGGPSINDISYETGARFNMENMASISNPQQIIQISGTEEQVKLAKEMIENCVAQGNSRGENKQSKKSSRSKSRGRAQKSTDQDKMFVKKNKKTSKHESQASSTNYPARGYDKQKDSYDPLNHPKLSQVAADLLANEYAKARNQAKIKKRRYWSERITVRTLELLIKVATTFADCRESKWVQKQDAIQALEYAYYKEILTDYSSDEDSYGQQRSLFKPKCLQGEDSSSDDGVDEDDDDIDDDYVLPDSFFNIRLSTTDTTISPNRLDKFKSALLKLFREQKANSLPLDRVTSYINNQYPQKKFEKEEALAALDKMTEARTVIVVDDIVFLL